MAEKSRPIYLYDPQKAKLVNEETLKLWRRYEIDMTLRELAQRQSMVTRMMRSNGLFISMRTKAINL